MFYRGPAPKPLDRQTAEALSAVQTSTLGHMRDYGFPRGLDPLKRPAGCVGPATTVRIPHMDSTALHVAADEISPGSVLVVDQSGDSRSCFGGMVGFTAQARGAVGAVIAGAVNDYEELTALEIPVYSSGVSARTTRILGIEGAINVPVTVGGAVIHPGDIVMCDSDGIAVLSREEATSVASILREKEQAEPALREKISHGSRLAENSGALELFDSKTSTAPQT